MAYYQNKLYLAIKGLRDPHIWITAFDGETWDRWIMLPDGLTDTAPALVVFDNCLYIAIKGQNDNRVWISSFHKQQWTKWSQVPDGFTSATPALASADDRLFVAVKGINDTRVWFNAYYPDGSTQTGWDTWQVVPDSATGTTPAMIAIGNQLYMVIKGVHSSQLWMNSLVVDHKWGSWSRIPDGFSNFASALAPGMGEIDLAVKGLNNTHIWLNRGDRLVTIDLGTEVYPEHN